VIFAFNPSRSKTELIVNGDGRATVNLLNSVPVLRLNGSPRFTDKVLTGKERTSFEVVGADPLGP
jgi:hypothetical protein